MWGKDAGEVASSAMDQPRRPASSRACNCISLYVSRTAEHSSISTLQHTHTPHQHSARQTDTRLTVSFSGQPGQAGTTKVKPIWILTKQEMIGWRWHQLHHMQTICTKLRTDNHASNSSLNFLRARCFSWHPTNGVKAMKVLSARPHQHIRHVCVFEQHNGNPRHSIHFTNVFIAI